MAAAADTIKQLDAARSLVLGDPAIYPTIVPGVLPVISQAAQLEIRRWGADFLAETFASPVLNGETKQKLVVTSGVLDTIRGYINRKEEVGQAEDPTVIKAAVQCAASIYPLVFRHTVNNAADSETWTKMAAIKSSILRKMDFMPPGVRICCVKYLANVVLVQTAGLIADPRRPEQNEISLALLSRDHPVLKVGNIEAEASGLLDRMLSILEEEASSALLVTATINSLAPLVHRRASISNKIITAILNFNPLRLAGRLQTSKDRVAIRSITRTTTSFLMNILKRSPQHTLAGRIQQQIDRLRHGLGEAFSEANLLKRPAPQEPTDGLNDAKRQRIDNNISNRTTAQQQQFPAVPHLPPGPVTLAQLFDLTNGSGAAGFHVEILPANIVASLVPALITAVDTAKLDWAINTVRARYLEVTSRPRVSATQIARGVAGEDDDDYDPTAEFGDDTERVMNELDRMPSQTAIDHNIKLGPFHLPPPPALTQDEAQEQSKLSLVRLFSVLAEKDKENRDKAQKPQETQRGFNRSNLGPATREGWIQTVIRVATRASLDHGPTIKDEFAESALTKKGGRFELAGGIRDALFNYIMEDFRKRINDAINWLSDEWYAERLQQKQKEDGITEDNITPRYDHWTLKFLDAIVPYLDVKDNRTLIRFFSEIPSLDSRHLDRLVKIADDPERVNLAVQTLLYLVMLRPPVREAALDAMETLWKYNEDAKKAAEKHLVKWRPDVVQGAASTEVKVEA
ncbi:hypothetical protein AMS68_002439 [Peltaster fructicola]|uniref:Symplekin/Pta1 N-terminal domain-containing protein n=1 Tax=Peltaster fructicola TaxID=286661 RepID=A0A6H0XQ78_9PEZI|nr:hypothetical protein AMS68_002439 [Peltaster fructicola]